MAWIYPVFHVNLLELWHKLPLEKNFYLGLIEHLKVAGKRYKVEAILYYKSIKNETLYEVKWLKWPTEDSMWEPVDYLNNCEYLLEKYWD